MALQNDAERRVYAIPRTMRLAVGVLQGTLLSLLVAARMHDVVPLDRPVFAAPLENLLFDVPSAFLLVWGRMRAGAIARLLAVIVTLTLVVVLHQLHQDATSMPIGVTSYRYLFTPLLFILLALALAAERDLRVWPSYPQLFETSWDLAVLLALAGLFVLLSWAVLWLMAGLFAIIGFHDFLSLLARPWIWPLISCVAFGAAIAFCIEGERLIIGARRLMLALFGLLLPILSGLTAAFLVALAFVPLSRLWTTHHAGLLLAVSAVLLILLLNAVYQDGRTPAPVMRLSSRLAAIEILPLTIFAVIALALRVHDHGWSIERVVAAAGFTILLLYGIGYLVSAVWPGRWLRILEPVNVGAAAFTILVIVALLTPIADPARIAVASQVSRLRSSVIPAAQFDYAFLGRGSGRYGREALARLIDQPPQNDAALIRERATAANLIGPARLGPPTTKELASNITVHPSGATLPEGLLASLTGPGRLPIWLPCLRLRNERCDAVILPTTADGREHVAIVDDSLDRVTLLARAATGWQLEGTLRIPRSCGAARSGLLNGQATFGDVSRPAVVLPSGRFSVEPPANSPESCSD